MFEFLDAMCEESLSAFVLSSVVEIFVPPAHRSLVSSLQFRVATFISLGVDWRLNEEDSDVEVIHYGEPEVGQ